jgi:mono/diheme cytochrome c family protein
MRHKKAITVSSTGRFLGTFGLALLLGHGAAAFAANPVAPDAASVARGGQVFQQYCTECHGRDGKAQVDVISDATDLTEPEAYYSGASQDDIFNSISNGAGVAMPAWNVQISDETDIWHLVNFIRSLWTEEQRAAF